MSGVEFVAPLVKRVANCRCIRRSWKNWATPGNCHLVAWVEETAGGTKSFRGIAV